MKRTNLLIACICGPLFVFGATVTWDGGGMNSNWSNAMNWSNDAVPTNADDVIINNTTVQFDLIKSFARTLTLTGSTILTVNSSDTLILSNTTGNILEVMGSSNVTVNGTIIIFGNSTAMGSIVNISTSGNFTIANGASLFISGFGGIQQEAIGIQSGIFTNNGNITLSSGSYGIADHGVSSFVNGSTGLITMTGISRGISYDNMGATFTNNGSVTMLPIGNGIVLTNATNIFENNGTVFITASDTLISNGGSGIFRNNYGGTFKTAGSGNVGAARFVNNGGKLSPGGSPGFMKFTGSEDFSNSIWDMEIADNDGVPGTDYDQIVIQNGGTATLGGAVLNVTFNYTPMVTHTYKIINASAISGTFSAINTTPAHNVSFNYSTGELTVQAVLPVELTYFKAFEKKGNIELTWQTASETNNEGFEIMRSGDGKDWEDIGFVQGNGSTYELHNYSFLDKDPLPGVNYYRLRQMDYDRGFKYSPVVNVSIEEGNIGINLYPNPATQGFATLVLVSESIVSDGILDIFDQLGRNIAHQAIPSSNDNRLSLPIDLTNYAPGIYTVCLRFLDKVMAERFEVVR